MDTPGLRKYESLRAQFGRLADPNQREEALYEMDQVWYALTPEERAWLDTREGA